MCSTSVSRPQGSFRKRGFLAPYRLFKLKDVPRRVGISLRNTKFVTLRKRCAFLLVAGRIQEAEDSEGGTKLCCKSQTFTSPGLSHRARVLLCFLSMVLTALPVFGHCGEKTMLREKNQYSIVLFLCHIQTERSHLFFVIRLSF